MPIQDHLINNTSQRNNGQHRKTKKNGSTSIARLKLM